MRGVRTNKKASKLRECVDMSLLMHLVKHGREMQMMPYLFERGLFGKNAQFKTLYLPR